MEPNVIPFSASGAERPSQNIFSNAESQLVILQSNMTTYLFREMLSQYFLL